MDAGAYENKYDELRNDDDKIRQQVYYLILPPAFKTEYTPKKVPTIVAIIPAKNPT